MKPLALSSLLLGLSIGSLVTALQGAESAPKQAGYWQLDLSGQQWQMEGTLPGQGEKEGFPSIGFSSFNWNGADVPGDVYTDLWRAGEIDDPHYGRNGMKAKWAMSREWWYRRSFKVPESVKGDQVRLVFEGVDYACDVWLNGHYLGRHEGMFSPFEFEVSSKLFYGEPRGGNALMVRLDPPPRSYQQVQGLKFGWMGDYWRTLTPMGIWKPVRLVASGGVHIADVYPATKINSDRSAKVDLQVTLAPSLGSVAAAKGVRVQAVVRGANFESQPYSVEQSLTSLPADGLVKLELTIPEAKLWWPWDMGEPNLYTVETTVTDASGKLLDRKSTRFGVREIRRERNPGYTVAEVKLPWTMVINGQPAFMRSAAWGGPPDIFYGRNGPEKYRKLVQLAKDANINNLRIFGWHPTEVDLFYNLCDEMGITVWQDLIPFSSENVREDEAFRTAAYAEAVATIKTLRSHPSLILIEGGEESFYSYLIPGSLEYTAKFLVELEQAIRPYTDLPYIPTSPLNHPSIIQKLGIGGPKDSSHPHGVFYQRGERLVEDDVNSWDYAAIPEFGVTSAPNVESIRKFIPPAEVWPPGPSWGYHWADLDVFRALNFQILGDERTGSLEEFVAATQIAQGTIFQYGIEYIRRRKPKSTAISICHLMTFSPDMKWGIVDYYQETKRSYDFVKRAFQPLLVSLQHDKRRWMPGEPFTGQVWIVNDYHRDYAGVTLRMDITDTEGHSLWKQSRAISAIAADSSVPVSPVEWTVAGKIGDVFRVSLALVDAAGKSLSANHYDLLCGDQNKARVECREKAKAFQAEREDYPQSDYYRYFPGLSGEQRFYQTNDSLPTATGFPPAAGLQP